MKMCAMFVLVLLSSVTTAFSDEILLYRQEIIEDDPKTDLFSHNRIRRQLNVLVKEKNSTEVRKFIERIAKDKELPNQEYLIRAKMVFEEVLPTFKSDMAISRLLHGIGHRAVEIDLAPNEMKGYLYDFQLMISIVYLYDLDFGQKNSLTAGSMVTRKLMTSRVLKVLATINSRVDLNWNKEKSKPELDIPRAIWGFDQLRFLSKNDSKLNDLPDDEKAKRLAKIDEEYESDVKNFCNKWDEYYFQEKIREIKERYTTPIIDYFAKMYSCKPYASEELHDLLKENEMSVEFTKAVLDGVEKRITGFNEKKNR